MSFDLDAAETLALAAPVHERAEFPSLDAMFDVLDEPVTLANPEGGSISEPPATTDYMTGDAWLSQWGGMHDMMGGLVMMRTGQPCPLGDQARSEGGVIAAQALYSIIEKNPTLASMILSTKSTFIGQVMAIGMHGFGCMQTINGSRQAAYLAEIAEHEAPEFSSVRGGEDG